MPTPQLSRMRETEFEFPSTRRDDDPMYQPPKPPSIGFVQVGCEKHEFIEVTQTTNSTVETIKWMQCKYCGLIKAIPEVNPFEDIT